MNPTVEGLLALLGVATIMAGIFAVGIFVAGEVEERRDRKYAAEHPEQAEWDRHCREAVALTEVDLGSDIDWEKWERQVKAR